MSADVVPGAGVNEQPDSDARPDGGRRLYTLRESQAFPHAEHLEALALATPDMMFRLDNAGRIVEALPAVDEPFLIPPEQFMGQRFRDVMPPAIVALSEDALERAVASGQVVTFAPALRPAHHPDRRVAGVRDRSRRLRQHLPALPPRPQSGPRAVRHAAAGPPRPTLPTQTTSGVESPWLFPGYRAGQHLTAHGMMIRIRKNGLDLRAAHNAALRTLVREAPAPLVAKSLGYADTTIHRHAAIAASQFQHYAASRPSRTSN